MEGTISFRPIQDDDQEFLLRVYVGTRAEELALAPWSDEQKEQFVRMQFALQHQHYQEHYADARFDIILLDEHPIGRLYVDRRTDEIRIIDIALLPEHQGQGIGGRIISDLLAEADEAGKPVTIHVLQRNRAVGLYDRLGFEKIGETGIHDLMEWRPGARVP